VLRIVNDINGDLDDDGDPVDVLDCLIEFVAEPLPDDDLDTEDDRVPVADDVELFDDETDAVPVLLDVDVFVDVREPVLVFVDVNEFVIAADADGDLDIVVVLVDVIDAVVVFVDVVDNEAIDDTSAERVSVDVFVEVLDADVDNVSITPPATSVLPLNTFIVLYSINASILKSEGGVDPIIPIPNKSNNHFILIL
jgi:hypothetical protein